MTSNRKAAASGGSGKPASNPARGRGRPTLSNEQLLDKALDLFLENGFERTSIDAITASAGMAKRTVYLRYGDKLALFKAALQRAIEEWIIPLERLQAAEDDDLEATLQRIGRILVDNIMTPAGLRLMRIANAESVRMPEIGAYAYQRGTDRTIAYLADLFRRRIKPAGRELVDAEEAAVGFLYLVVCGPPTMTAWGMTLGKEQIEKRTIYCVRLFLHGLLPRGGAVTGQKKGRKGFKGDDSVNGTGEISGFHDLTALEAENRRLKGLLVASMLETATLKEELHKRR